MMCLHLDVVLSYYDACSLNVLIAFQKYQSCSLALTMLVCEFRFLVTQILAPYLEVETARLEFYLPKHIVQREMQTCENSTSLPHVSLLCVSCEKIYFMRHAHPPQGRRRGAGRGLAPL